MTLDPDPCHLVPMWLMTLIWLPCHTGCLFMVDKLKKKDRQNLTLMTLDPDPCHLVPMWLMTLPLVLRHTGCLFMVDKLKKRQAKPDPNDS